MDKMFDLYSEKVMEYFTNPKNMGKMKNADVVATVGNPKCGDVMKIYLKVGKRKKAKKQQEYIKDIMVQTLGCGAAIATSSIATEMVKGKYLDEAMKLSNKDVVKKLGGLPKVKYHCSVLAEQGIKEAIKKYLNKKK